MKEITELIRVANWADEVLCRASFGGLGLDLRKEITECSNAIRKVLKAFQTLAQEATDPK
jgi:hypothetical protein